MVKVFSILGFVVLTLTGKAIEENLCIGQGSSNTFSQTIPLNRSGNLFFIESRIDGSSGNFILDTGAEGIVVNETYFRDFKTDYSRQVATINNQIENAKYVKLDQITLGNLEFKNLEADVVNLSQIENSRGLKVFGLVGLDFFRDFILELDFTNNVLILHEKDFQIDGEKPLLDVPTKSFNGVPTINLTVNGEKLRFILDTGAELNVIHNALDPKVYEGMEIVSTTELFGADGKATPVLVAKLRSIKIDEHELADALSLVLNMSGTISTVSSDIAGTLGFPFFVEGRLFFDVRKKRLKMFKSTTEQ